jgi:uncharacterized protein (DUF433 family)
MAIAFAHLVKSANGETRIAGRRITAYDVLCRQQLGETATAIATSYELPLAAVYEALAYALDHPAEMARVRGADEAAHQHALAGVPTDAGRGTALS